VRWKLASGALRATPRGAATSGEVKDLRREARALKEANSNHFRYGTFRCGTFGNVSTFWRAPVS